MFSHIHTYMLISLYWNKSHVKTGKLCLSSSPLDTPIPGKALVHSRSSVNTVKRWLCAHASVLSIRTVWSHRSYLAQVSLSSPRRACCTCTELNKRPGVAGAQIVSTSCWRLLAPCHVISPGNLWQESLFNLTCCVSSLAGETVWSFALEWCLIFDAWWFSL